VESLTSTDLVVGLFSHATYRNQSTQLERGDSLVLFTDGVTEAENSREEQLGLTTVANMLQPMHCVDAEQLLAAVDAHVADYIGEVPAGDDVTMLAVARCE
jgi:sigma-B regulation protein RsbU (phosphoserine phosphatase)